MGTGLEGNDGAPVVFDSDTIVTRENFASLLVQAGLNVSTARWTAGTIGGLVFGFISNEGFPASDLVNRLYLRGNHELSCKISESLGKVVGAESPEVGEEQGGDDVLKEAGVGEMADRVDGVLSHVEKPVEFTRDTVITAENLGDLFLDLDVDFKTSEFARDEIWMWVKGVVNNETITPLVVASACLQYESNYWGAVGNAIFEKFLGKKKLTEFDADTPIITVENLSDLLEWAGVEGITPERALRIWRDVEACKHMVVAGQNSVKSAFLLLSYLGRDDLSDLIQAKLVSKVRA